MVQENSVCVCVCVCVCEKERERERERESILRMSCFEEILKFSGLFFIAPIILNVLELSLIHFFSFFNLIKVCHCLEWFIFHHFFSFHFFVTFFEIRLIGFVNFKVFSFITFLLRKKSL